MKRAANRRFGLEQALRLGLAGFAAFIGACAPQEPPAKPPRGFETVAERISRLAGRAPIDYAKADHWGCSPLTSDDVCDTPLTAAVTVTDGTETVVSHAPANAPAADCFYIYPTVDLSLTPGNHDYLVDVVLPRGVITLQAAPFGAACRVFAPFYRQATIGSYTERPDRAMPIFLSALADVTAAFEYYLEHWNKGRPIVVLGHSQGAHMASYLLHSYFDGATRVTRVPGSEQSDELRARLVGAYPIGFSAFTPEGERIGGTFSDLPLCEKLDEPGCVTAYRSYLEGTTFFGRSAGADIDARMADLGLLHRALDSGDSLACVNPASGPPVAPSAATDTEGAAVRAGDTRLLLGSWAYFNPLADPEIVPGRYAATCRNDLYGGGYLAVSFHDPAPELDARGDPLRIKEGTGALGLHLIDFHIALGDLIESVRLKSQRWKDRQ